MTFGEKLRFARKEKKLTQKELASKIGAKHNSISNWEKDHNKPDPDTIQNLCWALDVTPNYFFSNEIIQLNENNQSQTALYTQYPILQVFDSLNSEGKKRLMEYAQDLAALDKYKKCNTVSEQEIG